MSMKWFADRGMKPTDCQANFMFVDIGTPAKAFRDACRAKGVMVARDCPPRSEILRVKRYDNATPEIPHGGESVPARWRCARDFRYRGPNDTS